MPLVQMASGSGTSTSGAILTGLMSLFSTPKAAAPAATPMPYAPPPSSGMDTNTMIAIGLGAVGLVAIILATRK